MIFPRHGHKCAALNPVALEDPHPAAELEPARLNIYTSLTIFSTLKYAPKYGQVRYLGQIYGLTKNGQVGSP